MTNTMKRAAYYLIAADRTWKRGLKLSEIQKGYMNRGSVKTKHVVYQMIMEDCTDTEATNVMNCFFVTNWGDIMQCDGLSDEDKSMLDRLFVGWMVDYHEPAKKS